MLRIFVSSAFVLAMTTGNLWALEAESVDDIVLLRAIINTDDVAPVPDLPCDAPFDQSANARAFFEIPAEGPTSLTPYEVPEGRHLVVTSFQWVSEDDNPAHMAPLADVLHFAVFSALLDGVNVNGRTLAPGIISDANGLANGQLVMPTGIVIPGGATVCMQIGASELYFGEAVGFLQGFLKRKGGKPED
jgi:hypothetical protein